MIMANRQYKSHNRKKAAKAAPSLPVIRAHAAGIDIGASEMYVSVPIDSSETPIGVFGAFTEDLLKLAAWLKECHVETVAMESTGVYWIPLYELLEEQGFQVVLVAPNYPKKPEKSDIEDCQWLQYLHSVGLLSASFRPEETVCAIRAILRLRSALVADASRDILRLQKSLTQMNLLLHNVISDITGVTGLAIIDAILSGERDPKILAQHRDFRIKASIEQIEKSLRGHYRQEHLFTLRQARQSYRFHQEQIAQCDAQIELMLRGIDTPDAPPPPDTPYRGRTGRNDIRLSETSLRDELVRINGVDLTDIPGVGPNLAAAIFAEVGNDLSKFPTSGHFASWLKTTPAPRISGGKILGYAKAPAKPRLGVLIRQAVQSLDRSDSYLGHFYRRLKARIGATAANKAAAHKLATIIYALLTTKKAYDETSFAKAADKILQKRISRFHKEAQALGIQIAPP